MDQYASALAVPTFQQNNGWRSGGNLPWIDQRQVELHASRDMYKN